MHPAHARARLPHHALDPRELLARLGLERRFRDVRTALADPLLGPLLRAFMRHRAHQRPKDRPMHLIGITGFAGAGKDSVYQLLSERRPGIARAAFADALKAEIVGAFGADHALFEDPAVKEIASPQLAAARCSDPVFVRHLGLLATLPALRPRTVMQQWGDYRRGLDPNYFVRAIEPTAAAARAVGANALVLTDVRYPNEAAWLRANGGVLWRVVRPGVKPRTGHASEWALAHDPVDVVIQNDGYLEMLARRVTDAFDELERRAAA